MAAILLKKLYHCVRVRPEPFSKTTDLIDIEKTSSGQFNIDVVSNV